MTAYDVYFFDFVYGYEYIGTLPERRKNPKRMTPQSVINWGRTVLGDNGEDKTIFFKQVTVDKDTGRAYWVTF